MGLCRSQYIQKVKGCNPTVNQGSSSASGHKARWALPTIGRRERGRTSTLLTQHRLLRPARLPFRHSPSGRQSSKDHERSTRSPCKGGVEGQRGRQDVRSDKPVPSHAVESTVCPGPGSHVIVRQSDIYAPGTRARPAERGGCTGRAGVRSTPSPLMELVAVGHVDPVHGHTAAARGLASGHEPTDGRIANDPANDRPPQTPVPLLGCGSSERISATLSRAESRTWLSPRRPHRALGPPHRRRHHVPGPGPRAPYPPLHGPALGPPRAAPRTHRDPA